MSPLAAPQLRPNIHIRIANISEYHALGAIRGLHAPLPRIVLGLDLYLPAGVVLVPDAGELTYRLLVEKTTQIACLVARPQSPVEFGFAVRVLLRVVRAD